MAAAILADADGCTCQFALGLLQSDSQPTCQDSGAQRPPGSEMHCVSGYPQSNGKMERWFKTLKGECIRVKTPLSLEDARRLVAEFVNHYNTVRLHSAITYITPADKLAGRAEAIWAARKQKPATANARRRAKVEKEGFAQS
jgi:Integrase core domain